MNPIFNQFIHKNEDYLNQLIGNSIEKLADEYKTVTSLVNQEETVDFITMNFQNEQYAISLFEDEDKNIHSMYFMFSNGVLFYPTESKLSHYKKEYISIHNNKFYYKNKYGRYIPLTLKVIAQHTVIENLLKQYLVFRAEIQKNPFLREFTSMNWTNILFSLNFNEILDTHNWNHFFKTKYKTANLFHYNFNKHCPNFSYLIIKSYRVLDDKSKKNTYTVIRKRL